MITNLKPYPVMKDSGVEWLGEVPGHWEVRKLRNTLHSLTERNRPDLPLLSVVREKGVILRDMSSKDENHNFIPDDLTNYKVVHDGQFAINKMKAWQGSYGVSRHDGIVSPAYCVFNLKSVSGEFLHTAIRSKVYVPFFTQASDGVRIGQWDLSQARMREIPFVIPPLPEQSAIVSFLDYVDRRIRRYIRAKQKLIGLLEEQKQAIIHRAVTRGLDPDVPLKPSGVEWLGEVPEHWDVRRLKHICRLAYGDSLPSGVRAEGDIPVYGSNGRVGFHSSSNATGPSLIIGRKGSFGKVNYSPDPVFAINTTFFVDARNTNAEIRWLYYFLGWLQLDQVSKDSAVPGLDRGDAYQRIGLYPPLPEQTAIVEYLDKATAGIDTTIAHARREISLLREYRTRLIADVVTGKLDVREAAASLPEETEEAAQDSALDEVVETELPGEDAEHSHKEHNDDQQ